MKLLTTIAAVLPLKEVSLPQRVKFYGQSKIHRDNYIFLSL